MKPFFLFLCLIYFYSGIAQTTITVKKESLEIDIESKLEYFNDVDKSEDIYSIQTKNFASYSSKYFPNSHKQKIWFRIRLKNEVPTAQELLFKIRAYAFIKEATIYSVNRDTIAQIFKHTESENRKIRADFTLKKATTYYFEVDFLWTTHFKLALISPKENQQLLLKENTQQGMYYGFSFLIIALNMLFFFFTKTRFFIFYALLQFSILISIGYLDNLVYELFGNSTSIKIFEACNEFLLYTSVVLFTYTALNLKKYFSAFLWINLSLISVSLFLFIIDSASLFGDLYNFVSFLNLVVFLICFVTAVYFSRKMVYARFIVAGYLVLFFCDVTYSSSIIYGYKDLGFYEWHYKIGSLIEMLIFLIAIPYRHQVLSKEKTTLKTDLSSQQLNFEEKIKELTPKPINTSEVLNEFSKTINLKKREL